MTATGGLEVGAPWMGASSAWAIAAIAAGRRAGVIPSYGSAQFAALDEGDPRRVASVVIAAECWWYEGRHEVMAERLREHLAETDAIVRWRIRATSYDVRSAFADLYPSRWGVTG